MKTLNYSYAFLLLFFFSVNVLAFQADPYRTKEFAQNGSGNLKVETSGYAVSVTGTSGSKVTVDMYVKYDGREIESENEDVEKELANYDLGISQSGNTISLNVKKKNNSTRNNKLNLSFKIQMPEETSSEIQSSGGSISIDGLSGDQHISTSGGSIQVVNSSGSVETKSSGGSFKAENFDGNVKVESSGGSIKVSQLTGDLEINTSGGSVNLEEINGSIVAKTSGGSIKAELSNLEKSVSMMTSGGSITAIVPEGLGLDLDLSGGKVNSNLSNFNGEVKKDRIVGKINGGGIPVTMQSSGGSINLEFN